MNRKEFVLRLSGLFAVKGHAQFTDPGAAASVTTVKQLQEAGLASVTTAARSGSNSNRRCGRTSKVSRVDKVRQEGELGHVTAGRYIWTKSLGVLS